jgi:hypothetical protein
MKNKIRMPLVGLGALGLALAAPSVAFAQSGGQTYQANLQPVPLNGQTSATGHLMLTLNGNTATISEQVSGLAPTFMNAPFPHVQHIHINAQGMCPTASADANHDGVISTPEAQPDYGPIGTTLSVTGGTTPADGTNVKIAPSGASYTYNRTITLDQATMSSITSGKAVIVVHGLNPATAPKAATTEKSPLVPSLPLAATAPALCGTLTSMPGAPATGGGGTAGLQNESLFGVGGALLLGGLGFGAVAYRRRHSTT